MIAALVMARQERSVGRNGASFRDAGAELKFVQNEWEGRVHAKTINMGHSGPAQKGRKRSVCFSLEHRESSHSRFMNSPFLDMQIT